VTDCRSCVVPPDVVQRFGKRLLSQRTVDVGGIAGEYELVVVSLGSERFGHTLVGEYIACGFRNKQNFINAIYFHPLWGLDLDPSRTKQPEAPNLLSPAMFLCLHLPSRRKQPDGKGTALSPRESTTAPGRHNAGKKADPIPGFRNHLLELGVHPDELAAEEESARRIVDEGVKFALASPLAGPDLLYEGTFA
jgi:hypothetical protein